MNKKSVEDNYDIYMADKTVGYDNRVKLFYEISQDIWSTLYCNEGSYKYEDFLYKYMNEISFFAHSLWDFKNLMYFALDKSNVNIEKEKQNLYKKVALGTLSTVNWFKLIELEDMEVDEAILLKRLQYG